MTTSSHPGIKLSFVLVVCIILGALLAEGAFRAGLAIGDPVDAGITETAPQVDNPVTDPAAAFDDIRAAKKLGWPALVIVALTALLLGLGTAFPSLTKGSTAFLLACGTAGLLAAGNAVLAEGSWVSIATAGALAAFGVWKSDRDSAARDRAIKEAEKSLKL